MMTYHTGVFVDGKIAYGKQICTLFVKVSGAEFSQDDVYEVPSCCLTYLILTVLKDELIPLQNRRYSYLYSTQYLAVEHRQLWLNDTTLTFTI
jgi:hypothetical protein